MTGAIEVDSSIVAFMGAVVLFFFTAYTGLLAWCLKELVSLSKVVAGLTAKVEDLGKSDDDQWADIGKLREKRG